MYQEQNANARSAQREFFYWGISGGLIFGQNYSGKNDFQNNIFLGRASIGFCPGTTSRVKIKKLQRDHSVRVISSCVACLENTFYTLANLFLFREFVRKNLARGGSGHYGIDAIGKAGDVEGAAVGDGLL